MLADAHRQAAEDIERTMAGLPGDPYAARMTIEACWGAAFHWIAYGCATKHSQRHDHHSRLGSYLRQLGEPAAAVSWLAIDSTRQGGWYGTQTTSNAISAAQTFLQEIRTWAQS